MVNSSKPHLQLKSHGIVRARLEESLPECDKKFRTVLDLLVPARDQEFSDCRVHRKIVATRLSIVFVV